MAKLKKLLDDSSKARRLRRIYLNIQITFLTWLIEFVGFLLIVFGSFIFGYKNSYLTLFLQMFSALIYIVVIPSMYLLNSYDLKEQINNSNFYIAISKLNLRRKNHVAQETVEKDDETNSEK